MKHALVTGAPALSVAIWWTGFLSKDGGSRWCDLAIHKFTRLMLNGEEIPVFGDDDTRRDYTFIDDIIQGIQAAILYNKSIYEVINLGNNKTVTLNELISVLERVLGVRAKIKRYPIQAGDVPQTWADLKKARDLLNFKSRTDLEMGLDKFSKWINQYRNFCWI